MMKTVSMRLSIASCGIVLAVLGGPVSSTLAASPWILTEKARLGPEGGTLSAPAVGFSLTFPPGALTRRTTVKLSVFHQQFAGLSRPGYVLSPHGAEVSLHVTAVAPDAKLIARLGFQGGYDRVATTLAVENARGFTIALPLYTKAVPPDGVVNDGLVAGYSAQSAVLGLQSASWQPGPIFDVSHHELVTNFEVLEGIGNLIASW